MPAPFLAELLLNGRHRRAPGGLQFLDVAHRLAGLSPPVSRASPASDQVWRAAQSRALVDELGHELHHGIDHREETCPHRRLSRRRLQAECRENRSRRWKRSDQYLSDQSRAWRGPDRFDHMLGQDGEWLGDHGVRRRARALRLREVRDCRHVLDCSLACNAGSLRRVRAQLDRRPCEAMEGSD